MNEDIISATLEDIEDDDIPPTQKVVLLDYIFKILTDLWFQEFVPRDFKRTVLRPFLKDSKKDSSDPSNYRPISLLNTIMKIYEGIICKRVISFLEENDTISPLQAAYRNGRSTSDHILVLHELFLEYRFNKVGPRGGRAKKILYMCFLDFKKAFDTVVRYLLFLKLAKAGIQGKILRVIQNLFSSNPANVLVGNFLSPEFEIHRGVLQGSKLGPVLFNLFINDLLDELHRTNLGATIGTVHIPALGFADDIVLISDDPIKLQKLIDICEAWSEKNLMGFNTSKCDVMIFNGPPGDAKFTLSGKTLQVVESHKYLGITITSKYVTNLFRTHFSNILEKARVKASVIKRHGFHKDGLRISTAIRLYKLVIRPLLEYCAQSLSYARYSSANIDINIDFVKELEQFQTRTLKTLINCPRSTSPAILRLFCGVEPLACRLEILKLRYYWKVLNGPTQAIAHQILVHRKSRFLEFNKGIAHEAFNICCKYNIVHIWHGIASSRNINPGIAASGLVNPLRRIKDIIISRNINKDLDEGKTKTCTFAQLFLKGLQTSNKRYRLVEPFSHASCFATPIARKHFVKALLHPGTYLENCCFCGQQHRDRLKHFLSECTGTSGYRKELHLRLTLYNFPQNKMPLEKLELFHAAFTNELWRKCIVKFLRDIDF